MVIKRGGEVPYDPAGLVYETAQERPGMSRLRSQNPKENLGMSRFGLEWDGKGAGCPCSKGVVMDKYSFPSPPSRPRAIVGDKECLGSGVPV